MPCTRAELQPDTVVAHGDFEHLAPQARLDAQGAAFAFRAKAVLDRVLGQREHGHRRHASVHQRSRNVDLDAQPLAHADLLDLDVGTRERELASEREVGLPRICGNAARM